MTAGLFVFSQNATKLSSSSFKTKIWNFDKNKSWKFEGKKPAIIYFYTDWSAACKKTTSKINELKKQFGGKVDFYKVNSDDSPNISVKLGIREVPAVLFARPGAPVKKMAGKLNASSLKSEAEKIAK